MRKTDVESKNNEFSVKLLSDLIQFAINCRRLTAADYVETG